MSHSTIYATARVQYLDADLNTVRSEKIVKDAVISVVKDENKDVLYIRISPSKKSSKFNTSFGFPVTDIKLFDKCIDAGMSTIKLPRSKVQISIKNCPPDNLKLFITTLRIKLKNKVIAKNVSTKEKLSLSMMDTVSPVTKADTLKLREKKFQTHFKDIKAISPIASKKKFIYDSDDMATPPKIPKIKSTVYDSPPPSKLKLKHSTSTPNRQGLKISDVFKDDMSKLQLKKYRTLDTSLNDSFELTEYYKLTAEQICILEKIKFGDNVFYTGSAGTGKTFLIKKIIGILPPSETAITASTGVAASIIDGCTLHSFAGIGAAPVSVQKSVELILKKPALLQQWRKVKHLIIDEISLITAEYFDHLDQVGRRVRNVSHAPFGGIQMILCGDFCQLPPVIRGSSKTNYKFAFQSRVWSDTFSEIVELTEVKRQTDKTFIDMLNIIRVGQCPSWVKNKLEATKSQIIEKNGIVPTKLCTHRVDVEEMNLKNLNNLNGNSRVFEANDSVPNKETILSSMCRAETRITLKVGAQVMLIRNMDLRAGLVNGARGVVVRFADSTLNYYPIVKFVSGKEVLIKPEVFSINLTINGSRQLIIRRQLPLCLAYAISVHKSQGMTLDCVELYLNKTFESGQAYVALSRCKSLDSMKIVGWTPECIFADESVLKFYSLNRTFKEITD